MDQIDSRLQNLTITENSPYYENYKQEMKQYEQFCDIFYGSSVAPELRAEANQNLEIFNTNVGNLPKLKFFLENSENEYVQYLAPSAMKNLLAANWEKIDLMEKLSIKNLVLKYLSSTKILCRTPQAVKMIILLLTKISKLAWLDDPEIR